jgi:chromate transporter
MNSTGDATADREAEGGSAGRTEAPTSLSALAWLFLKLGTIAFGGPAAHIAMMEDELVRRRRLAHPGAVSRLPWSHQPDPGPQLDRARHPHRPRAPRRPGLLVAGACFILPATLIVTAIAWAYERFGALPEVGGILYGVKPVVIALVVQATLRRIGAISIPGSHS